MKPPSPVFSVRSFRPMGLWSVLAVLTAIVHAQTAPQPASPAAQDGVTRLSPFVVSTSGDTGYQAQNSISGSRLNTKLTDLAVPTTPFTLELLQDIGSTSVDDLVEYMVNARPDYPETENLYWGDDSLRFRIRGLPAFNYSVNFFESSLRLDHYNTERVEQSRGPNSILFGLGSPGGVVNVATKRAVETRTFASVSQQIRANHGWRTVLDANYHVLPGKLALRLAGVRDHRRTWRHHEYDNQDRLYLAAGWQVARSTRVDAEWEHGLVDKSLAHPRVAIDAYTAWANAGKVLSNTPNAALGIARFTTANRVTFDTGTGAVSNTRNTNTTVINQVGGVNVYFDNFRILPREVVLDHGPAFPQTTNYTRGSVFVTHAFSPKLNVELAANYQKSRHDNMQGRGYNTLQVDTTVTLPSGAPNPNAGRAFVDGFPGNAWSDDLTKDVRASAAYQFDLGWFGSHQLAGLYQADWLRRKSGQSRPAILENPFNTTAPENGQNAVFFRTYYDLNGPTERMTAGDWRRFDLNNIVIDGQRRRAEFINYIQGGQNNRFERDSAIGILQSHWLKNRLVTAVGYRVDWQDSFYSPTGFRGAPFGPFAVGLFETPQSTTPVSNKATNLTYSGLFRLTDWLAVTYNQAENSALPDPTAAVIAADGSQRPPSPRGESRDMGIKVNLGSRLSLNAIYFETSAQKDLANVNNAIERRYAVIWDALAAARVPAPGGGNASSVPSLFNRYTFDSRATGYEFELIANPTKNWRLFMNYSSLDLARTNLGAEGRAYLAKYRDYWLQGTNGRIRTDGSGSLAPVANNGDAVIETVAEEIGAVDAEIQNFYVIADGEAPRGQNRRRINLRTNYSFDQPLLKGFSLGGGLRYRSPEVIAYEARATGSAITKRVIYGVSEFLVDFNVGYRGRARLGQRDVRWSAQLNVNNLLNETDIVPMRSVEGRIIDFRFQPPRDVFLTLRFEY